MKNPGIEKAKVFIVVEVVGYLPKSVVVETIYVRPTGSISAVSFDCGEAMAESVSPFDVIIQIIEGDAEIIIDDKSNKLGVGQAIVIPAHSRNSIHARVRFKMLSTTIKSGYED